MRQNTEDMKARYWHIDSFGINNLGYKYSNLRATSIHDTNRRAKSNNNRSADRNYLFSNWGFGSMIQ